MTTGVKNDLHTRIWCPRKQNDFNSLTHKKKMKGDCFRDKKKILNIVNVLKKTRCKGLQKAHKTSAWKWTPTQVLKIRRRHVVHECGAWDVGNGHAGFSWHLGIFQRSAWAMLVPWYIANVEAKSLADLRQNTEYCKSHNLTIELAKQSFGWAPVWKVVWVPIGGALAFCALHSRFHRRRMQLTRFVQAFPDQHHAADFTIPHVKRKPECSNEPQTTAFFP